MTWFSKTPHLFWFRKWWGQCVVNCDGGHAPDLGVFPRSWAVAARQVRLHYIIAARLNIGSCIKPFMCPKTAHLSWMFCFMKLIVYTAWIAHLAKNFISPRSYICVCVLCIAELTLCTYFVLNYFVDHTVKAHACDSPEAERRKIATTVTHTKRPSLNRRGWQWQHFKSKVVQLLSKVH